MLATVYIQACAQVVTILPEEQKNSPVQTAPPTHLHCQLVGPICPTPFLQSRCHHRSLACLCVRVATPHVRICVLNTFMSGTSTHVVVFTKQYGRKHASEEEISQNSSEQDWRFRDDLQVN